jgi:hypothetical protein
MSDFSERPSSRLHRAIFGFPAVSEIGQESVISNVDEASGKNMKEEAAEELHRIEGHGFPPSGGIAVVLPLEADFAVPKREQPRLWRDSLDENSENGPKPTPSPA